MNQLRLIVQHISDCGRSWGQVRQLQLEYDSQIHIAGNMASLQSTHGGCCDTPISVGVPLSSKISDMLSNHALE